MPNHTRKPRNIPLLEFTPKGLLKRSVRKALAELGLKYCSKCKIVRSVDDFVYDAYSSDNLRHRCRSCSAAILRKWHADNPSYRKNTPPEKAKQYRKKYAEANRDKIRAYSKSYYWNNRAAAKEYDREYRQRNLDRLRQSSRNHYYANPEMHRAKDHRRRARLKNAEGSHTPDDLKLLWEQQGGRCAYCDCELYDDFRHLDHVQPLSKGGSNYPDNLAWSCPNCNLSKGDKTLEEWIRD